MIAGLIWKAVIGINLLVLSYFIVLNVFYLVTSLYAFRSLRRYARRMKSINVEQLIASAGAPPITLIAPAYNEEATCVESVRSMLLMKYRNYEVMVVNDGSSDETLERLRDEYDLVPFPRAPMSSIAAKPVRGIYRSERYPNLWVVDKENGGKADALNVGLNYCNTPLFCAMDSDTLLEANALIRIVRPFLEDSTTVAVGGIIRIVNDCDVHAGGVREVRIPKNLLAQIQVLEYLRAFLFGRMGWDALKATLIISGAFGMFKRSIVIDAGGFRTDTVGEDMELIVRLHAWCRERKIPYNITFVPDPVAWTEVPESLRVLGRQRDRWQRGLWETLMKHRRMLLNPRYGRIGMFAYPYFFFLEMLGPVVEALGYTAFLFAVLFAQVSGAFVVAFLMVAIILGLALSFAAVGMEELTFRRYPRLLDLVRLFGIAVIENFGYRQLVAFWRFRGVLSALSRKKGWGKMQRRGFAAKGAQ